MITNNFNALEKPSVREMLSAKTAKKILKVLLREGTGWVFLLGAVILLTADVWLGANVLQAKGMSGTMAWTLSAAFSALQIALFMRGSKIVEDAATSWQFALGIAALVVGWIVVLADSLLDAFASFVQISHQVPSSWSDMGVLLKDPITLICFLTFFVLSFMGERLARLIIGGIHDEIEEEETPRPRSAMSARPQAASRPAPSSASLYNMLPDNMQVKIYLRNIADGVHALVVGTDESRYIVSIDDPRLIGRVPVNDKR